MFIHSSEIDL